MSVEQGTPATRRWTALHLHWGTRNPLSTRDIATIAVLAALGGVMSAYVGYLGMLLNKLVGVPFGAGQFMAGLHVFWIVLAVVVTNRVGVGTASGLLKGTVEMLAGSGKGVLVILLSVVAGLIVDAVWLLSPRRGTVTIALAGGLATASNVIIFLLFTGTYEGLLWLFSVLLAVSFVSGVVFAGLLVRNVAGTLYQAGIMVRTPDMEPSEGTGPPRPVRWDRRATLGAAITIAAALLFFGGAVAYFSTVGDNIEDLREGTVSVGGLVDAPYTFDLEDLEGEEVTVRAELVGTFTHVDEREYTGVPLRAILERAGVGEDASVVHVIGVDEYGAQLDFDLGDVMSEANASSYILVEETGELYGGGTGDYYRLVCRDLEGSYWVRWVVRITVG